MGYEVSLVNFCEKKRGGLSDAFSGAFQKGGWKILVPGDGQSKSLVANAEFTDETCKKVEKRRSRFENVKLIFNSKIAGITDDKNARLFVSGVP